MESQLQGRRVLVTRAVHQSASMCARIRRFGGEPVVVPVISYRKAELTEEDRRVWLDSVRMADWIVLTSKNALDFFMDTLDDPGRLKGVRLAAVGKKTGRALETRGLKADFVPERFTVRGVADAFRNGRLKAARIAVPLGSMADTSWFAELRNSGIAVTGQVLYETVPDVSSGRRLADTVAAPGVDAVTFASPSAVRFFTELLDEPLWRKVLESCTVAAIGTATARALESLGYPPDVVPEKFTAPDMIDALADYYKKKEGMKR
ncbi:uroporphyrinogen-III synthase [Sporolactobacillus sp. CQH2019]|uniref:uroporphyrinogen-III synthase n=1 Tax=Sporolactobacillus sp. CQH2019 TaxID=3023512 RepID=UPI00236789C3|nr:uroporphyrinogen-III synthase [Sporolactobacillus sp. CQH2019]MDD9147710.1 uroporphyrinogen-III synthase [Sporolactobacillus sp. CQH2019]